MNQNSTTQIIRRETHLCSSSQSSNEYFFPLYETNKQHLKINSSVLSNLHKAVKDFLTQCLLHHSSPHCPLSIESAIISKLMVDVEVGATFGHVYSQTKYHHNQSCRGWQLCSCLEPLDFFFNIWKTRTTKSDQKAKKINLALNGLDRISHYIIKEH